MLLFTSTLIIFFCVVDVFICGGYNGELILADLWKINLQNYQWSKLPAVMPEPAYFHCAAVTPVSTTQQQDLWLMKTDQGLVLKRLLVLFEFVFCHLEGNATE